MAGGTLAGQKGSPVRMHRAAVHEGGVRKLTPLPDGAGPFDSPDKPRPLIQRAAGRPKHAAGIKRESHGRRWNLREWGRRPCRRIVAIDALVRIDGDEYGALSIDREVLQERRRLPRRDRGSCNRNKISPIVIAVIVFDRCDHLHASCSRFPTAAWKLSHHCAVKPPSTSRLWPVTNDDLLDESQMAASAISS